MNITSLVPAMLAVLTPLKSGVLAVPFPPSKLLNVAPVEVDDRVSFHTVNLMSIGVPNGSLVRNRTGRTGLRRRRARGAVRS